MEKLSKSVKGWIIVSVTWAILGTLIIFGDMITDYSNLVLFLFCYIPLVIGWGIWWIRRE